MSDIAGILGTLYVDDVEKSPVTQWDLTIVSDNKSYAANDTAGWKKRVAGIKDSRGSFVIHVDSTGNAPVSEGDSITLKLHIDNSGNNYYTVPAMIDEIKTNCNINAGNIIALQITFSGNGALTKNGILAESA